MALEVKIVQLPDVKARVRSGMGGDWSGLVAKLLDSPQGAVVPIPIEGNPLEPAAEGNENAFYARCKSVRGILSKTAKDSQASLSATIFLGGQYMSTSGLKRIPGVGASVNGVLAFNAKRLSAQEMAGRYGKRKGRKAKSQVKE